MKVKKEIKYGVPTTIYESGMLDGLTYYIVESYNFPCAYVVIPKSYEESKDIAGLAVHGGLTYDKDTFYLDDVGKDKIVLGWDYGHAGDFMYFDDTFTLTTPSPEYNKGKRWTRDDIMEDVSRCIECINWFMED